MLFSPQFLSEAGLADPGERCSGYVLSQRNWSFLSVIWYPQTAVVCESMTASVYICMHVHTCVNVYLCARAWVYMHVVENTGMCVCMHLHRYICQCMCEMYAYVWLAWKCVKMWVCIYMCECMCEYVSVQANVYLLVTISECTCVSVCVHECECIWVCICVYENVLKCMYMCDWIMRMCKCARIYC